MFLFASTSMENNTRLPEGNQQVMGNSRQNTKSKSGRRPFFDGDERKFEIWELKFTSYLRICGLKTTQATDENVKAEIFDELVQCLDDRSIGLIIRDARDDGDHALQILRNHYRPKGKARVITLYTELTSLIKSSESVTDYMVRAETIATALREAEEQISDGLLIAMILKGLPKEFKPFSVVINDKEKLSFAEFKIALRNYEDNENLYRSENDSVMKFRHDPPGAAPTHFDKTKSKPKRWCSKCKTSSHDTQFCKRYCTIHKTDSHWTSNCRSKNKQKPYQANSIETEDSDHSFAFMLNEQQEHSKDCSLLVDSGATVHILNNKDYFKSFDPHFKAKQHKIELADGTKIEGNAEGKGDAQITLVDSSGTFHEVKLQDCLYIPSFRQNIFSVSAATNHGATVSFNNNSGSIIFKSCTFILSKMKNLYFINTYNIDNDSVKACHSLEDWHHIMGHCNSKDILKLESCTKNMIITNKKDFDCETCIKGKMTVTRNRKPDMRAKSPLELVHLDLEGPIEPASSEGFKYVLGCTDDYTGIIKPYFMKKKSDTTLAFQMFIADVRPFGEVKCVRSDNGGEFESHSFKSYLLENKIKHEFSAPYSPHQNGTAERSWRTLFEMARCLLVDSQLDKTMWPYAVMYASHIRNRCFNCRTNTTPYESLTGKIPDMNSMRKFGSVCYVFNQNAKKLDDKAQKGIFVGCDKRSPSFLVFFPQTNSVKRSRNVKFVNLMPDNPIPHDNLMPDNHIPHDNHEEEEDFVFPKERQSAPATISSNNGSESTPSIPIENDTNNTQLSNSDLPLLGKGARTKTKPKYLNDYLLNGELNSHLGSVTHSCYSINSFLPQTYSEAISCTDAPKWEEAMNREMHALVENDTFDIVPLPKDSKAIKSKWVYTIKEDKDENQIYKARFVAKGYSQIEGIDYSETFSPTARMNSIRIIAQISVDKELDLHQMDVKAAYLNAPIDCIIYVDQPEGFVIKNENHEKLVLKLKKSLYGLKQSGRNWNNILHNYLIENNFQRSINEPCFYFNAIDNVYLLVWVDDLIISAKTDTLTHVKQTLEHRFRMKDLGQVSLFLGIEFEHDVKSLCLSQAKYITKILARFGMLDCKPKSIPCEMKMSSTNSCPLDENELKQYKQIVGALIYLMVATRPDISFTVTKLSQYMTCALQSHMTMAKHVLRYLKGNMNEKLCFTKIKSSDRNVSITGFCDADWANGDDRKSITGYCFKITDKGPMISWKSRKQPTVALSSCEAEYMALASATQEGKYLLSLLNEILNLNQLSFKLKCDNQAAISLTKNPINHNRSKHIDIKYHFLRDEIENNALEIQYVPTEDNVADVFTKPMSKIKFQKFKSSLFG